MHPFSRFFSPQKNVNFIGIIENHLLHGFEYTLNNNNNSNKKSYIKSTYFDELKLDWFLFFF